jgi:hypothetical protein
LLKKKDILEEQNKFLFDDPDYLELLSYQATVYRQIYFSRKSDYCSSKAFRSYVCFPYVKCDNPSGKSWIIEVLTAEELFWFPYPFELPKSFLLSSNKNDLRLKVRLMKSLAVSEPEKTLDLEEFFNTINVRNDPLIQIKKNLIQLLNELVGNNIIQNKIEIELKSGKKTDQLIEKLTPYDLTRRIKSIRFHEKIKIL